jgi:glucan phosphoethanolaminetransferase (alkaline phosphatase superfamily)
MIALGSAMSCFQICYVIKFDLLFSMDPQELGRKTFCVLAVIIILPDAIVSLYNTTYGIHGADMVALLTQTMYNGEGRTLMIVISFVWILLALSLGFTAYVLIPLFLKSSQPTHHNDQLLQRKKSLKGILLWSIVLLIFFIGTVVSRKLKTHRYRPIQPFTYVIMIIFVLLLVYLLKGNDYRSAVKRYIFGLLQIEVIQSGVQNMPIQNTQESLSCFSGNEISKASEINPETQSKCFSVVAARDDFILTPTTITSQPTGKPPMEPLTVVEF